MSAVSLADLMADNVVIHAVDQLMISTTLVTESNETVGDFLLSTNRFSTLATALIETDLLTTLSDESATFTLLAPTNAAFDKIADTVLADLQADTDVLTDILRRHIIKDVAIDTVSAYALSGGVVKSIGNDSLSVSLVDFSQTTNGDNDEVAYDNAKQRLVGETNSTKLGFTLYRFDSDLGSAESTCDFSCATRWPPVLVHDGEVSNIPGLSLVTRNDGSSQAAYKGQPLYFYLGDANAGDSNGQSHL